MIPTLIATALLSAAPAGAAKPAMTKAQAAIVAGQLPESPARSIVLSKCQLCHTADYVTQQRLTPVQWQKTVEKMRKLGSPLTDDEVKLVSDYLGEHWTLGVPERPPRPVRAPANLLRFK
ncbi:MAG TPA: hypothetical protein VIV57_07325 [Anaeromyxobacter sp.]